MKPNMIVPTLDKICLEYGLKKCWISDYRQYVAKGNDASFIVNHEYDGGTYGRITAQDKKAAESIFKDFVRYFGVERLA